MSAVDGRRSLGPDMARWLQPRGRRRGHVLVMDGAAPEKPVSPVPAPKPVACGRRRSDVTLAYGGLAVI